jgi:protein-S-isoprenylcysteine O-methyltransferase Ste14
MLLNIRVWIEAVWIIVGIVWAAGALRLKPAARMQSGISRLAEIVPLVLAAFFLFGSGGPGIINSPLLANTSATRWSGFLVTIAGALIAIFARFFLGSNWSGRVTIKQGHELIRTGPYAIVRHPIYSGLLLSVVGTAIAFGGIRHVLAIPLTLLGWWAKIRQEEQFLTQEFGEQYASYRREVRGAIIPYVL